MDRLPDGTPLPEGGFLSGIAILNYINSQAPKPDEPTSYSSYGKKSASEESSIFDFDFSTSQTHSYTGSSSSSSSSSRPVTAEEIEAYERLQRQVWAEYTKNLVLVAKIVSFPFLIAFDAFENIDRLVHEAIWNKLPDSWKYKTIDNRTSDNYLPAKILGRLGIAGVIGMGSTAAVANHYYQIHLAVTYPSLKIAIDNNGNLEPRHYNCPTSATRGSSVNCKEITELDGKMPDCIGVNILPHLASNTPERIAVTDLFTNGRRNANAANMQCNPNDVWIGSKSISCSAKEVFFCNNSQTMDLLYAELLQNKEAYATDSNTAANNNDMLGIGIKHSNYNDYIKIDEVLGNGPAYQAGIRASSHITHINDTNLKTVGYQNAVSLLNDQTQEDIKLKLRQNFKSITVDIEKDYLFKKATTGEPPTPTGSAPPANAPKPPTITSTSPPSTAPAHVPASTIGAKTATPTITKYIVTATSLNLRAEPNTQSKIIGTFAKGSCLAFTSDAGEPLNIQDTFAEVTMTDRDTNKVVAAGYVSGIYLAPSKSPATSPCNVDFTAR
jgi:hypothetical protein